MLNLLHHEFYKLWSQRIFSISLAVLCTLNLFFLWNNHRGEVSGSAYRSLNTTLENMNPSQRHSYLEQKQEEIYGLYQLEYFLLNEQNKPNQVYYS